MVEHSNAQLSPTGRTLRWGAGLALVVLTGLHPAYSVDAAGELYRISSFRYWLAVHLALLGVMAAFDISLLSWPGPRAGLCWRLRQLGVAVHLTAYSAFLGIDGIAGGLLAQFGAGAGTQSRQTMTAAIAVLFGSGVVLGLALLAGAGWLLAALALLAQLAGHARLLPAAGLLLAALLVLSYSHSPPVGPVGALLAVAACAALDLAGRRPR